MTRGLLAALLALAVSVLHAQLGALIARRTRAATKKRAARR